MNDFLNIIDWLYKINATFGVDHVVIGKKVYWLDTETDRKKLYELYNNK